MSDEEPEPCPDCGKPDGSFACKIRHIHIDKRGIRP